MLALLGAFLAPWAVPAAQDNEECYGCHDIDGLAMEEDGRQVSLRVAPDRFDESVHGALDCTICHWELDGVEEYPHPSDLERVDCTMCHDDDDGPVAAWRNSTHGRLAEAGDPLAPLCQDCHGGHYVLPLEHPDSSISPFNVPAMCAQCHAEGAPVERAYDLPQEQVFQRYRQSIHGEGLFEQGLSVTAVCTSCHTGHNVLPHTDPESTIHADNVSDTCMQCHGRIREVHRKIVAGELWLQEGAVPICVECHGPHEIRKVFYDTNMSDADCLRCHSQPIYAAADGRSLYVDGEVHAASVHGRNDVSCAQCHDDVTPSMERPCATVVESVDCDVCHEAEVDSYERGRHGRLLAAGDPDAPTCVECHGVHDMLEHQAAEGAPPAVVKAVRGSPTHHMNVPALCARCHAKGAATRRRDQAEVVAEYEMSIHGKGLRESGLTVTAVCTDCHGAHLALPAADPESTVHVDNVARTCGRCHEGIEERFALSVHSPLGNPDHALRGDGEPLPVCNDCHASHETVRTDLPAFQLGVVDECGTCHEEITKTYFDTYHGKATALGDTTRAKCFDCHGSHEILPADHPRSTLNEANAVGTCGKCHEGAHPEFTTFLAHATHHDRGRYPTLYYAYWGMTGLLIGVFAFFGLHTLAWLPRSFQVRRELRSRPPAEEGKQFLRFSKLNRGLHLTVILSFFGLAITGMMLKFSSTAWARTVARALGGIETAGWIHRVCAVATFGYMAVHLWDVARRYRRSGKSLLGFLFGKGSILPRFQDVRDFFATLRWFVGRGPMPRFGRWTYWEKFDYFAVFWGVVIIGLSGLVLWFPELCTRFLPGWSINFATIIHSDEALLATGFIFTVHFFNTQLRPDKFPMDTVMFTGRQDVEELRHERPALYEELAASGELEHRMVDPPPRHFVRLVKLFAASAILLGLTLAVLIAWSMFAR